MKAETLIDNLDRTKRFLWSGHPSHAAIDDARAELRAIYALVKDYRGNTLTGKVRGIIKELWRHRYPDHNGEAEREE